MRAKTSDHRSLFILATPLLLAVVVVVLTLGCDGSSVTTGAEQIRAASLVVEPSTTTLAPGERERFTAGFLSRDGREMAGTVTWEATGGTITADGEYTAGHEAGDYRVTAHSQDLSASAVVTIREAELVATSIEVTPSSVRLMPSESQGFVATVRDQRGEELDSPVTWEAMGGSITDRGFYTAGSVVGDYQVRAQSAGLSAIATVKIREESPTASTIEISPESVELAPSEDQQFVAVVRDEDGDVIESPVTWDATGGTITTDGLYTAGPEVGDFQVRAQSGGLTAIADVFVREPAPSPPTPASIEVSPTDVELAPDEHQQFQAVVRDQDGERIDSPVTWEAMGGTISEAGLYTAGADTGHYIVRAWSDALSATANVTIREAQSPSGSVSMLGAWGCSQVSQEWNGVRRQSRPFDVWTRVSWGGMALSDWYAELSGGTKWNEFATIAANEGTSDVYAEICIRASDGFSETEYRQMAADVFGEMREILGPEVRIWATGMADWEGEVCKLAGPEGAEVADRMADHVVSLGLARRALTVDPWQLDELEGDQCHPNDQGEDRAGQEIIDFFSSVN